MLPSLGHTSGSTSGSSIPSEFPPDHAAILPNDHKSSQGAFHPPDGMPLSLEAYLQYAQQYYTRYYFEALIQQGHSTNNALMMANHAVMNLMQSGYFNQLQSYFIKHCSLEREVTPSEAGAAKVSNLGDSQTLNLPYSNCTPSHDTYSHSYSTNLDSVGPNVGGGGHSSNVLPASNVSSSPLHPSSIHKIPTQSHMTYASNSIPANIPPSYTAPSSSNSFYMGNHGYISQSHYNNVHFDSEFKPVPLHTDRFFPHSGPQNYFALSQSTNSSNATSSQAGHSQTSTQLSMPLNESKAPLKKTLSFQLKSVPTAHTHSKIGHNASAMPHFYSNPNSAASMSQMNLNVNSSNPYYNQQKLCEFSQNNVNQSSQVTGNLNTTQEFLTHSQYSGTSNSGPPVSVIPTMDRIRTSPSSQLENFKASRFDMTAKEAALKKCQEVARQVVEEKVNQDDGMLRTSTNSTLQDSDKSFQFFIAWLQKLYHENVQKDDTAAWRRKVKSYNELMIAKFKDGKFYGRDWSTTPVPARQTIIDELSNDNIENKIGGQLIDTTGQDGKDSKTKSLMKNRNILEQAARTVSLQQGSSVSLKRLNFDKDYSDTSLGFAMMKGRTSSKKLKEQAMSISLSVEEEQKRRKRVMRFNQPDTMPAEEDEESTSSSCITGASASNQSKSLLSWQERLEIGKSTEKIVGTSTSLEKPFLRLTGPPDPALVRPKNILEKAFYNIIEKYKHDSNWLSVEEQFRSIRQDMTVQCIKDNFTLLVYETNGRYALENHDLGQFNQCQTQLRDLYRILDVPSESENRIEFLCYRLLYMAFQNMRYDMLRVLGELSKKERQTQPLMYVMRMRRAIMEENWSRYFRLATNSPYKARHLCDIFKHRIRLIALVTMTKASRTLEPQKVADGLHFSSISECMEFLRKQNTKWTPDCLIDSKASCVEYEAMSASSKKIKAMG